MNTFSKPLGGIVDVKGSDGVSKYYYSLLPHEEIFEKGLISEAIAGQFSGDIEKTKRLDGSNFVVNPKFIELLQKVIEDYGPKTKELIAEAKHQESGMVVVIDQRIKDKSSGVPPEDIIGLFEVAGGIIGKYQRDPNYTLWTEKGFCSLPESLGACLLHEIRVAYGD